MKLKQLPDLLAINFICECSEVWESDYSQAICQFGNFSHLYLVCTQGLISTGLGLSCFCIMACLIQMLLKAAQISPLTLIS